MIITKKALPRRTILRGLGATVALPLLDGMVPALTALADGPAKPVRRFGVTYLGNGQARNASGEIDYWRPKTDGALELSPILQSLEPFRDRLVLVSGLDNEPALNLVGDPGGAHSRVCPAWLSGLHAKPTIGADYQLGITMDQIAASELGRHTQLPSLQVALFSTEFGGACETGYSCAYTNTVSWAGPTQPMAMEHNPRAVFERLFGDSGTTDPKVRLSRMRTNRSILDVVTGQAAAVKGRLGSSDRVKLTEYLEAVRGIEQRVQKAEAQGQIQELPLVLQPAGVPESFVEYCQLMYDLQVLAFQTDLTRIITFIMVREQSSKAFPEAGVPDAHHSLSHHLNDSATIARYAKVNAFHMSMFAYFLEKLQATADGDGTLLDHSLLMYGSGMGNSNLHDPKELPILLAGGGTGQKTGRHLRYAAGTPVTNLHLTILDKLGVQVDRLGDSTGRLEGVWGL